MKAGYLDFDCFKCRGTDGACKHCIVVKRQRFPFQDLPPRFLDIIERVEPNVLVVGAGIGGIASAIVLSEIGFKVTLLEKDLSFSARKQGYGLTIQQGISALRELNIQMPTDTVSTSHYAFNDEGKILGYFGSTFSKFFQAIVNGEDVNSLNTKNVSGKFDGKGKYNVHIPRQKLRHLLYQRALQLNESNSKYLSLLWGVKLEDVSFINESHKVRCNISSSTSTRSEEFDFVIGADGIFSSVRNIVYPKCPLQFLNCVVVLGISSFQSDFLSKRVFETNDGVSRLYVMPFDYSASLDMPQTMWQLSFKVSTIDEAIHVSRSPTALIEEAKRRCGNFHAPIPDLINTTPETLISGHPVFDRKLPVATDINATLNDRFEGKVFLLGDALHPMSPFKGQGANQALLDATLLGKTLITSLNEANQCLDLQKACSNFHSKAIQRSTSKVRQSKEAVDLLHSKGAIAPSTMSELCSCPVSGKNLAAVAAGKESMELGDFLEERGISAASEPAADLDKLVVKALGPGSRPHLLHRKKVLRSREEK